jgi:hydrogenase-4 component B
LDLRRRDRGGRPAGRIVVYAVCLGVAALLLATALAFLIGTASPATMVLPLGLPWRGVHLRLDPLAAFFMAVVDLGAVLVSVYALGYNRGGTAPPSCPRLPAAAVDLLEGLLALLST